MDGTERKRKRVQFQRRLEALADDLEFCAPGNRRVMLMPARLRELAQEIAAEIERLRAKRS